MKKLGYSVSIILLLGIIGFYNNANAGLIASQPPQINGFVGEIIPLTVTLGNNGNDAILATVTPIVPSGVATDMPFGQPLELGPGIMRPVNYNLWAEQVGTYPIRSQIDYDEGGSAHSLYLESDFTVLDRSAPMPQEQGNSAVRQLYSNSELDTKITNDKSLFGILPPMLQGQENLAINQPHSSNGRDIKTIKNKSSTGKGSGSSPRDS